MRRRLIFNLLLVFGVIALATALWLTRRPPTPEPAPVSTVAAAEIRRIEVHHADEVIVLARGEGGWRLREPVAARADTARVSALLALARSTAIRRYARDAIESRTAGLDPPRLTLRFNDEAPIALGGPGPARGSRYVRTAHALLLVAATKLENDLLGEPLSWPHWLAPGLLADHERLQRLTVPNATLARSEGGGWRVEPASADRGAGQARATIEAWRHARARTIRTADRSKARSARVTLRFAHGPLRHLDVIAREPELILRDAELGVDYHLSANHAGPLIDMLHPAAIEPRRGRALQPSAISLVPTADANEIQE